MDYDRPIIQGIDTPASVNINAKFTVSVTVVDGELVVAFYAGELYSSEGG